jgi:serine protease inhibitor
MRGTRTVAGVVTGVLLATACADVSPATDERPPGDAAGIDAALVASLSSDEAREVAGAVNAFGFDLLQELRTGRDADATNTIVSPLSVATLLAMLGAGAGGETARQIAEVLHLEGPDDPRIGALLGALTGIDHVTLSVTNAVWSDDEVALEAGYLEVLGQRFGATAETADLGSAQAARDIDAWVEGRTGGRIPGIAQELGLPDPDALLVLANAVYFLGDWTTPFDPELTSDRPFVLADGSEVDVPLMHLHDVSVLHGRGEGFEVLRLPYGDDGRIGLDVLLPDEGRPLAAMLGALDLETWTTVTDQLTERQMDLVAVPRFELAWDARLGGALVGLGMEHAFSAEPDFTRMTTTEVGLGTVVHVTYLRVDERGTEAAAVTAADLDGGEPAAPESIFRVDRPFAFTISDHETGTILFLGAVADPSG